MAKRGYVYILTNRPDGTLYIGVTSDLVRRVWEHRTGAVAGFTRRYALKRLVYFEVFEDLQDARARERAMKAWRRAWKLRRIESSNPAWRDLYDGIARS